MRKTSVCTIDPPEIMLSFDVVSLFIPIPKALALQVTKNRLEADPTISERTNLPAVNSIMNFPELCITNKKELNGLEVMKNTLFFMQRC